MYSLLTKRIKTYHNVKFCEYEITHNADASNEFQYAEFNEYEESEIVEIDIPESTDQNMFTEFNIESSAEAQNINSSDASQNVSPKTTNTSITSHCSEHNQQSTHC